MKQPLRAAVFSAGVGLIVLASLSFVCGLIMGLIDHVGAAEKPILLSYGTSAVVFGMMVFGLPVAIVTAAFTWHMARSESSNDEDR
jgi:hypothetical protein